MDAPSPSPRTFRFGPFQFDPRSGELRRDGTTVRLQEQPFQILKLLLAQPGEVVTREEMRRALWPGDTFVDFDVGLNSAVKRLRDALHDSADAPRYVETLPRRGYRFVAPLLPPPDATAPSEPALAAEPTPVPVAAVSTPARPARPRSWILPATASAAALAVAAAALLGARVRPPAAASPGIRSLAVLPFQNLTGDPEEEYFVDGVTEALTTDLAQVHALTVISRTSAMLYRKPDKPLPVIGQELGVDAVVEGAVSRSGDQVRITAQLIEARTDRHLWARTYDGELKDVLALQGEVATAIAQAVEAEIRPEERSRLAPTATVAAGAYESYLKGRFYWRMRGRENMVTAAGYFERAILEDPAFAPAYSGLSDFHRQSVNFGLARPLDAMPKAEVAARKAVELDDALAEAHASLAGVLYRFRWDWAGADREFRRALALDPSSAETRRAYAVYLLTTHRDEEALGQMRRALALSPLSPVIAVEAGYAATRAGHFDQATAYLRRAREMDPDFARVDDTLALLYLKQGEPEKAAEVIAARRARKPRGELGEPWAGFAFGLAGRQAEARAELLALEGRARREPVPAQALAEVRLAVGDRDAALGLLEKAVPEKDVEVLGFSGPLFDQLKDEPRYRALVARMGLAPAYYRD